MVPCFMSIPWQKNRTLQGQVSLFLSQAYEPKLPTTGFKVKGASRFRSKKMWSWWRQVQISRTLVFQRILLRHGLLRRFQWLIHEKSLFLWVTRSERAPGEKFEENSGANHFQDNGILWHVPNEMSLISACCRTKVAIAYEEETWVGPEMPATFK